jgi:hypothetical protein
MALGLTGPRLSPARRQEIRAAFHEALWGSFLAPPGGGAASKNGFPKVDHVLTALEDARDDEQTPSALIAMGAWNLLRHYVDGSEQPKGLSGLVEDLLKVDIVEAIRLRRERRDLFPPLRDVPIVRSRWTLTENKKRMPDACIEMTVLRPLEKMTKSLATWLGRSDFFWRAPSLRPRRCVEGGKQILTADVHLPGESLEAGEQVVLEVTAKKRNELQREFEFTMSEQELERREVFGARIRNYSGSLVLSKEESRPDRTHVLHSRHVQFASKSLKGAEEETLAYWIQTDTLCLALH